MSDSSRAVSVKGVLFRTTNGASEVLLLRNDRHEWELPRGRIEVPESPTDCLSREFQEETGLIVEVGPCVHNGLLTITPPYVPKVTHVSISAYGCRMKELVGSVSSLVLSDEHIDGQWVPISHLAAMSDLPEVYRVAIVNWNRMLEQAFRNSSTTSW